MQTEHLKVGEVARQLKVSRKTLYAWIAARRIGHTRIGRTVRIPIAEVRRLVKAGTVKAERV